MLALAGMAMANVLLPSLVKLHFPDRIGRVTAIYTTALAVGLTAALLLTVPIADAFGGWRAGLGVLGAGWPLVAAVPWLGLVAPRPAPRAGPRTTITLRRRRPHPARAGRWRCSSGCSRCRPTPIFGWFAQLWRDNGYSAGQAGAARSAWSPRSAIPLSLWLPAAVGPARATSAGCCSR